jgi:N6-adenosine-specific RNA methylase IME4
MDADDAGEIPLALRRVRPEGDEETRGIGHALVRYDAACRAIAEAKAVDEVKNCRDQAEALRAYARQAKNRELEIDAAEIRLRAERRLGELIKKQKATVGLNAGARGIGKSAAPRGNHTPPTLAEAGIDKKLSSRAQKLAALPEEAFQRRLGEWRQHSQKDNQRVTTSLLKNETAKTRNNDVGSEAHGARRRGLEALIAEGKLFPVIYAPLSLKADAGERIQRLPQRCSATVNLADMKTLPVVQLAAKHGVLFLWTVAAELPAALGVIKAWGFVFRTVGFVRIRPIGEDKTETGARSHANIELCLLATCGPPQWLTTYRPEAIIATANEHGASSDRVKARIAELLTGPYLDVLGREQMTGWTVCGEEIDDSSAGERSR